HLHRRWRQVGEGSAELYRRAGAAADDPDADPDGEPGEGRAVDVRGAVPRAEPDAGEGDPRRGDRCAAVGRLRRCGPGDGRGAVVRRGAPLPPGEAGGLGLRRSRQGKKKKPGSGRAFSLRLRAQFAGLNSMVRRVVIGEPTGSNRQRSTADSAARAKVRGGEALTPREEVTVPSVPTVTSTSTEPAMPRRCATRGYSGGGRLTGRSVFETRGAGGGAAGCSAGGGAGWLAAGCVVAVAGRCCG